MNKTVLFISVLFLFACKTKNNAPLPDDLVYENIALTWNDANSPAFPKISAHRGGMDYAGYPENALETIQYVFAKTGAIIECDIAATDDGQLILLHDSSLDRTTTCDGKVSSYDWEQIDDCKLRDPNGQATNFEIPTLDELLDWADDKGVLFTLDIKRGVPFEKVVDLVRRYDYFDKAAIITYNVGQAQKVHRLAPEAFLSVTIRNEEELQRMQQSGIPIDRMIAFTGTRTKSPAFYEKLDQLGIPTILGTLGNLDKRAKARNDNIYQNYIDDGVDILATNRPLEAFAATYQPAK
ncbi:MAG: glycerophosphodiester phosphodiesterase family protein [Bacteroidota bacterium]